MRVLNKDLFPNGFVAFLQASPLRRDLYAIVQHANWVRDHNAKTYRAREILSWHMDSTERYTTRRKYITYQVADDNIAAYMEKDYLQLIFMLAKILRRELILPRFHCYIGEPASCYMDAIFDTYGMEELGYYENSFLRNPEVPKANLRSLHVQLPQIEDHDYSLKNLLEHLDLEGPLIEDAPLLEISFPLVAVNKDHPHFSLRAINDIAGHANWSKYMADIEEKVKKSYCLHLGIHIG